MVLGSSRFGPRWAVIVARVRVPLLFGCVFVLFAGTYLGLFWWAALSVFLAGLLLYLRVGRVRGEPVTVHPVVSGRWMALNSPVDQVPSHGLHAYGQSYAIDLVAVAEEPGDKARPEIAWRPLTRPPEDFPAFGRPVYAPAAATVVRTRSDQRDHRSRNSWPAVFAMIAESAVRELRGPTGLLGNHIVLDLHDGTYAVLAHLKRDSIRVGPGDRVAPGEQVADCGNSGNSAEPHVHFQLMDHHRIWAAAGLPFEWARFRANGRDRSGVPRAWRPFQV